jgi:uncharacterized membrane-anchored protein YitT (DUF2179 family)
MDVMELTINFAELQRQMLSRLEKELPGHLTYHNAGHTREVIDAVADISKEENLTEEETLLLLTAALFHDAGFLRTYNNHEEASCDMAAEILPRYGYTPSQVDIVCQLIMATRLPIHPKGIMEQIICDADLHYLGTDRYFPVSERLYEELKRQGLTHSRQEWQHKEILFLGSHQFYTETAKRLYGEKKAAHLARLAQTQHKKHHQDAFISDLLLMLFGVFFAGFGLKGFLLPNHFVDGGVTGISLVLNAFLNFDNKSLSYVIFAINLPFIIVGYFSVSKRFAYKTLTAIFLLGLCIIFIPYKQVTNDHLLTAVFGGVFLGLGSGLAMRGGCALDGIEVFALYTLKKTSFTVTEIIMAVNIVIFAIIGLKRGWETSFYSILTYMAASRMIDYVIEGIQAFTGVTIISGRSETLKHRLVNELGRSITIYKGERGFLPGQIDVSTDCDIIFTVVTRLELRKLKNLVAEVDPKAFIFANTIREASGGILKRRTSH